MTVEVPGMKSICCNVFTMMISNELLSLQACLQSANGGLQRTDGGFRI